MPSLQKLLSLRQQQQQERLTAAAAPSQQFPPLTLPSSKRSRPSPDAVLPPVTVASACGSQVTSTVSSSSPASSGHSSPTMVPFVGATAAPAASVLPSVPRFAVPSQENNGSSGSSGSSGNGSGQMAMIYSPSLEGNVPVKALPLAQLTVSTQKIFKFRTFSVFLELNSAYVRKQRLTSEDILKAGLSAKCCKESTPGVDIFCCPVCSSKKRVIDLSVSNQQVFGPRKTDYGTEIYTFDTCKTNCSSSRDHHKSNICIVIDSLPGAGTIVSPPLVLQAREKQQSLSKSKGLAPSRDHSLAPALPPLPALAPASQVSTLPPPPPPPPPPPHPHPVSVPPPSSSTASSSSFGPAALPSLVSESVVQPATTTSATAPPFAQLLPRTPMPPAAQTSATAWAPVFSAAVAQSPALDVKVKVTLMSSMLPAADIERSVQHFKTYLQQLPGFVQFKYSILPGFFVGFTFFDTEEHHNAASVLLKNYLQNTNGVTNIFNENLVSSGAVVVLAACTSW